MQYTFYKYQGTGNDFVIIDDRSLTFPVNDIALVERLCNRRFGIGADGLMLLQPNTSSAYFMKYYNSDGRESTMCGNGGRCLAAFALHQGVVNGNHTFMAIDGLHDVEADNITNQSIWIKLHMQDVQVVDVRTDNTFVLNTGSPHYVQFLPTSINNFALVDEAKKIRYNTEFNNDGINVNFVNLLGLHHIEMRTYERGVEDETLSCGTGVTAAALSSAMLNGLPHGKHEINVTTPGGALKVSFMYHQNEKRFTDVWLQGPATFVFKGAVDI